MSILSEKILELRNQGKTYNEIAKSLDCSKGTIAYYLDPMGKSKHDKLQKQRRLKQHPLKKKLEIFLGKTRASKKLKVTSSNIKLVKSKIYTFLRGSNMNPSSITLDDIINKFGDNPVCYLSGDPINIMQPNTYEFDHVIPRSRGGQNNLDNLNIASKEANRAKNNMTPDEYFNLCKKVLEHQGFTVSK